MNNFQIKAVKEKIKYNIQQMEILQKTESYSNIEIYDIKVVYNDEVLTTQYLKVVNKAWDLEDLSNEISIFISKYIRKIANINKE